MLTDKQKQFIDAFSVSGDAAESYIQAGYLVPDKKEAMKKGRRLLKTDAVKAELQRIQNEQASKNALTIEECRRELSKIIRDDSQTTADRLKAIEIYTQTTPAGEILPPTEQQQNTNPITLTGVEDASSTVSY